MKIIGWGEIAKALNNQFCERTLQRWHKKTPLKREFLNRKTFYTTKTWINEWLNDLQNKQKS